MEARMWNPLSTKKKSEDCRSLRDILENAQLEGASEVSSLSGAQQKHLAACSECQQAADDILMTRTMLRANAQALGSVRALVCAASDGCDRGQRIGAAPISGGLGRCAALCCAVDLGSALALLLASTWLYKSPQAAPNVAQNSGSQSTVESLFDSPQSSATDDVLPAEKAQ